LENSGLQADGRGGAVRSIRPAAPATGWRIRVEGTGNEFECSEDEPVLIAMMKAYVADLSVGCRRGGCGLCRTRVLDGEFHVEKMSRAHVDVQEEKQGIALACRLYPRSDMTISPHQRG
jgi:ferredoxin